MSLLHLVVCCEWVLHLLDLERSVTISILISKLNVRIWRRWCDSVTINASLFTQVTDRNVETVAVVKLWKWHVVSWKFHWFLIYQHAVTWLECLQIVEVDWLKWRISCQFHLGCLLVMHEIIAIVLECKLVHRLSLVVCTSWNKDVSVLGEIVETNVDLWWLRNILHVQYNSEQVLYVGVGLV